MNHKTVSLPYSVYRNIVDHLSIHASTDSWAESCLKQLEEESEIRESVTSLNINPQWAGRFNSEVVLIDEESEG